MQNPHDPNGHSGGMAPVNNQDAKPKTMKRKDAHYIDTKLREVFIRGHAMNVHRNHMDLARGNAQRNARRKIP